ncbi:MAG: molybdenum-binding transcriptional regulator [Rhodobacteraceae bacterium]|nr:molybdenum-binding transcriptional regulator [Paracoccaceae bacterium]MBT26620.1 molybdenum-binding transcriptional regulator [Paracoccaceae bacterium]
MPKAPAADPAGPRLRIRLVFDDGLKIGPGKAELLEQIDRTGSISAAGRAMGMSYRRAWALVEEMNRAFRAPLVLSSRGGTKGGGARLTGDGRTVLQAFRTLEQKMEQAGATEIADITRLLSVPAPPK